MIIRKYILPSNQIGRSIIAVLLDKPNINIVKLSVRKEGLEITVSKGYPTVERILSRFNIRREM